MCYLGEYGFEKKIIEHLGEEKQNKLVYLHQIQYQSILLTKP